jgi:hypothetical protein
MTAYGTPTPTVRPAQHAMPGELPVSVRPVNPVARRASDVVAGLRTSPRFALAVGVYQVHQRDGAGRCRSCGSKSCRSRGHAATIIAAAGVNLADVDMARCGIRLRRHQRAVPVRGASPQRVKIATPLGTTPPAGDGDSWSAHVDGDGRAADDTPPAARSAVLPVRAALHSWLFQPVRPRARPRQSRQEMRSRTCGRFGSGA